MTSPMTSKTSIPRKLVLLSAIAAALLLLFLGLNLGGWRDRIIAKLVGVYNPPTVIAPPAGFVPQVPRGFQVSVFAHGFESPRWLATAPNGDIFVADSSAGKVVVLQDPNHQGQEETRFTFAEKLSQPFGIAFHD